MTRLFWALLLWLAISCHAQTPCSHGAVEDVASQVQILQKELKDVQIDDFATAVPAAARDRLTELKDALSCLADVVLAHAGPLLQTTELQNRISRLLPANSQERDGPSGQDLTVNVARPQNSPKFLAVDFSVGIQCGDDHVLLVYAPENDVWKRQLRWQAPPLQKISSAFGDFFVSGVLLVPSGEPSIVVAHGTPWCTSRFSGFAIDILSPGSSPDSPRILWHTQRPYSRADFSPTLTCSGDTFELRLNESSFDVETFERRVIYRYKIDEHQAVHRIGPIAIHARGLVEEWLAAPWAESEAFSAPESSSSVRPIHEQFQEPQKSELEFVTETHGPVRACKSPGTFQVEIRSTLNRIVPGKPGGESQPLPTHYFHVREVKDGYVMVSAPLEADPGCQGADLMANRAN